MDDMIDIIAGFVPIIDAIAPAVALAGLANSVIDGIGVKPGAIRRCGKPRAIPSYLENAQAGPA